MSYGLLTQEEKPAGPDEYPRGSSPQSPHRDSAGADTLTGFQALSFGSHHFVGALDFQPRPAARIPLAERFAVVRPRSADRRIGQR